MDIKERREQLEYTESDELNFWTGIGKLPNGNRFELHFDADAKGPTALQYDYFKEFITRADSIKATIKQMLIHKLAKANHPKLNELRNQDLKFDIVGISKIPKERTDLILSISYKQLLFLQKRINVSTEMVDWEIEDIDISM